MRIYMSLSSIPELQSLSPNDRQRVWSKAYSRVLLSRIGLLGVFIMICTIILGEYLRSVLGPELLVGKLMPSLGLASGLFLFFVLAISKARSLMPGIIAELGQ